MAKKSKQCQFFLLMATRLSLLAYHVTKSRLLTLPLCLSVSPGLSLSHSVIRWYLVTPFLSLTVTGTQSVSVCLSACLSVFLSLCVSMLLCFSVSLYLSVSLSLTVSHSVSVLPCHSLSVSHCIVPNRTTSPIRSRRI